MAGRTPIGKIIQSTWTNLNVRCSNGKYKHLSTISKSRTYDNISLEFTREEFKQYCLGNSELILSLERPSIDRRDSSKNYSIDNIRFIELRENIAKEKTVFKDGKGTCFSCKGTMDIELFCIKRKSVSGYANICKSCDSNRSKLRYLKKKESEK